MRGAPIAPDKVTSPAPAVSVRLNTPATVLDKVKFPPPELRVTPFVSVIAEATERVPAVVIFEPRETLPAPVWVKLVADVMGELEAMVKVPLLVRAMEPLLVLTALLKFIAAPLMLMALALKLPLNVVGPVAAVIVNGPERAAFALTSTFVALGMVREDSGVVLPMAP